MTGDGPVGDDEWRTIVANVPIVSVDLVVRLDGGVVLGERTNEPGKGEWFVPGGRVHKSERLADAVHRVASEELGVAVEIERRLGVYEHFWDAAEYEDVDGKHYVPIAFLVTAEEGTLASDDQHEALRRFEPPFDRSFHPYVETYLADAGFSTGTG